MPKAKEPSPDPGHQKTQAAEAPPIHYDVRIHSLRMDGARKGTASVNLNGQFAVRGVSVMEGPNGLFVSMPSRKIGEGEYQDICFPCTKESRAELDKAVITAFEHAQAGGQEQKSVETLPLQYTVRIHSLHPGDGALKGIASVSLNDQFAIRRVSVLESSKGLFVSMPGYKGGNGEFKDYCFPCTKESRAAFDKAVLNAYGQALTQSQTAGQKVFGSRQVEAPSPFVGPEPSSDPTMQQI